MSKYRRLISYIYAYEGGVKGKNVGYAKIEVRNGQCKISVSIKKVYVGSNEIGVYLLADQREIFMGNIFIRNGGGEFRAMFNADNIEGNGLSMDQCHGLTVHDVESAWQAYTTIWEDAVAHAAEIELADITAENRIRQRGQMERQSKTTAGTEDMTVQAAEAISGQQGWGAEMEAAEMVQVAADSLENNIEENLQNTEPQLEETVSVQQAPNHESGNRNPYQRGYQNRNQNRYRNGLTGAAGRTGMTGTARTTGTGAVGGTMNPANTATPGMPETTVPIADGQGKPSQVPLEQNLVSAIEMPLEESVNNQAPVPAVSDASEPNQETRRPKIVEVAGSSLPGPGDPQELETLERQDQDASSSDITWSKFQCSFPKLRVFDYENGCEIISIRPQDLGLLPREIWVYGNNSFLLHGYYNYRYLILAKLNNPDGEPRYLLGVPGHYYSNEKYMASMFGFPSFVLSKQQPQQDSRFGYWYTDIRI